MTTQDKIETIDIGQPYRFVYPNYGTPDSHPDYTAHSGQIVVVERQLRNDECDPECGPAYWVKASDGWRGNAHASELRKVRKPKQVAAVLKALIANAREAKLPRRAVYCSFSARMDNSTEWSVGSNREDGSSTLIFRDGKWFYRDPHTGSDKPVKGGYDEALANTTCWFTG